MYLIHFIHEQAHYSQQVNYFKMKCIIEQKIIYRENMYRIWIKDSPQKRENRQGDNKVLS